MDGDDIGPEIVRETVKVIDAAAERHGFSVGWQPLPAGVSALAEYGSTLPEDTIAALRETPAWILGPVSHLEYPVGDPRYVNPSGHLRKHFALYSNVRPDEDTVISVRVVTRRASRNVIREAFELAVRPGRAKRVTAVHKANVLKY